MVILFFSLRKCDPMSKTSEAVIFSARIPFALFDSDRYASKYDRSQGVSLLSIDATKVRLTPLAPVARRVGTQAASRRPPPIVGHLVRLLHWCSRCDTVPPSHVPELGC